MPPSLTPPTMATLQIGPLSPWLPLPSLEQQHKLSISNTGHMICLCKSTGSEKSKARLPCYAPDKPSAFDMFVSTIRQCGQDKSLLKGKQVHGQIDQSGYGGNVFLGNCLIEMYGECGSLADAQYAFDHIPHPNLCSWNLLIKVYAQNGSLNDARKTFLIMPEHDVISWSTMIAACARHGQAKEALVFYDSMQSEGVKPNNVTFLSALDACSSMSDVTKGHLIHASIVDCGYNCDVIVGTALVNMYSKCGDLNCAQKAFHCLQERDVVAWNAMILACSDNQNSGKALQLYDQMKQYGVFPTKITFLCVIEACKCAAYLDKAHEIHTAAIEQGFEQDVAVGTALTQMYGKCGSLHSARAVFTCIPQRTTLSWNTMIAACTANGDGKEALRLFHQMQLDGVKLDNISFASILDACAASVSIEDGKQIHSLIRDCKLDEDEAVGNALINMYGKCGSLLDAREVFDKLPRKGLISWTAMMTAFAQNGHGHDALDLFEQMNLDGVKPDMITFLCALDACICASALKVGTAIHAALVDNGYEWDLVLRTSLVNMYAKCGSIDDSRRTFGRIPKRDVVCWNTMLAACAQNGNHKETLKFFNHMQLEGIKPDKVTFFYVLTACIHTGKVDEGRQHFYSMVQKHGLEQMGEHVFCMVDLLSRAGHLGEAEALITTMSLDKIESGLASLLTACNIHGGQKMAENAAEQIFSLGSEDASSYVLLSNVYAAMTERFEDSNLAAVL
eukprot:c23471_g6_i1 orf=912-3110(-)